MKLVIVESPFAVPKSVTNQLERDALSLRNQHYLRACALWCLDMGWSPYASHKMLTKWLDDDDPEQRHLGITAGLAWARAAQLVIVGANFGITPGMVRGIDVHEKYGTPVEYLWFDGSWHEWAANWPNAGSATVRRTSSKEEALRWWVAA